MKTLIIFDGPIHLALPLTSLIVGLRKEYGYHEIDIATSLNNVVFFNNINGVRTFDVSDRSDRRSYEICINYADTEDCVLYPSCISAKKYFGVFDPSKIDIVPENEKFAKESYSYLNGVSVLPTRQNIFQVLYRLAGLVWRGEGYGFKYTPKNKEKGNLPGIAVINDELRLFLKRNLEIVEDKLWHIPIKQDPIKQFDEVNRCASVITDNPFIVHVAVSLFKHVEFLTYNFPLMRMEFFGEGNCHIVPKEFQKGETT